MRCYQRQQRDELIHDGIIQSLGDMAARCGVFAHACSLEQAADEQQHGVLPTG